MQLVVDSFNGTDLNDANFQAYFPVGSVMLHPGADPIMISRENNSPTLVYMNRRPALWQLHIIMLGTIVSQVDTLKGLFNPNDKTLKQLIVLDAADSDRQWYVECVCDQILAINGQEMIVNLVVPDPIWKAYLQGSDTWGITASGQTNDVAVAGTVDTSPIFEITPTTEKDLYTAPIPVDYRHFVKIYNRIYDGLSGVPHARALTKYPIDITNGGLDTAALIADNTNKCQIDDLAGITDDADTIPYDTVTGTIPDAGMAMIESEQVKWSGKTATTLTGVARGIGGTTAAAHADDVEIKVSKMLANGDDVRVVVDGADIVRWFGTGTNDINTANTKIWVLINLAAVPYCTLAAGISGTGAVTAISLSTLIGPEAGRVLIDNEIFTYTAQDPIGKQLLSTTRAAYNTAAAAHTAGTRVYRLDHEIWLVYGDAAAVAAPVDVINKPIFNLTSTNTSWDYDDFYGLYGLRAASWRPYIVSCTSPGTVRTTGWYTTSQDEDTPADPAPAMGISIGSYYYSGAWRADTAIIDWELRNECGFTHITATGYKYRDTSTWFSATYTGLYAVTGSNNSFTKIWVEATPAAPDVWSALTAHNNVSFGGTARIIKLTVNSAGPGGNTGGLPNRISQEFTDVTLTLDSNRTPGVVLDPVIAPPAASGGGYHLNCTITNNDTNEWMTVDCFCELDQTVIINCADKTVIYDFDGSNMPVILGFSSIRHDWLNLKAATANTLQFDDTGTTGVTFVTKWRDRKN